MVKQEDTLELFCTCHMPEIPPMAGVATGTTLTVFLYHRKHLMTQALNGFANISYFSLAYECFQLL